MALTPTLLPRLLPICPLLPKCSEKHHHWHHLLYETDNFRRLWNTQYLGYHTCLGCREKKKKARASVLCARRRFPGPKSNCSAPAQFSSLSERLLATSGSLAIHWPQEVTQSTALKIHHHYLCLLASSLLFPPPSKTKPKDLSSLNGWKQTDNNMWNVYKNKT